MFDNLLNLVRENAGDAVINNPAVPNNQNEAVINTATTGIMDHLKTLTGGGGISSIMNLLKGGHLMNNPEIANMCASVAKTLSAKFGLDQSQAGNIVQSLIPKVMSQLASKTNDPNDKSFSLEGITGALTKGNLSEGLGSMTGLGDKIGGMFGK